MENQQQLLNAISTLSASIDTLMRAGKIKSIGKIEKKIIELVEKIR